MNVGSILAVIVGGGSVEWMLGNSSITAKPLWIVKLHGQINVGFVELVGLCPLLMQSGNLFDCLMHCFESHLIYTSSSSDPTLGTNPGPCSAFCDVSPTVGR